MGWLAALLPLLAKMGGPAAGAGAGAAAGGATTGSMGGQLAGGALGGLLGKNRQPAPMQAPQVSGLGGGGGFQSLAGGLNTPRY